MRVPSASYSGPTASRPCSARPASGDPQQAQARGVPGLVLRREVRVVVDVRVEDSQRDESPVHSVVTLGGDHAHPLARHPGERADGVEVEVQVRLGRTHAGSQTTSGILRSVQDW